MYNIILWLQCAPLFKGDSLMKKLTLSLAAILLVSLMLTACSGWGDQTKEAYSVFLEALEKQQTAKAIDISLEVRANLAIGIMSTRNFTKMHVIGDITDEANPELFATFRADSGGKISETTIYSYNGYAYIEEMGTKTKKTISVAEIIENYRLNAFQVQLFDETQIVNGIIRNVDGGKEIIFTVKDPTSLDYIKNVTTSIADILESGGADPVITSITAEDMPVTAFVDNDGVLKSYSFNLIIKIKHANGTGNANMLFKSSVNALDNVTVPKPEDESAYTAI